MFIELIGRDLKKKEDIGLIIIYIMSFMSLHKLCVIDL